MAGEKKMYLVRSDITTEHVVAESIMEAEKKFLEHCRKLYKETSPVTEVKVVMDEWVD